VDRTNISILLATALLGVLLWIVISMARDLSRAPDEPLPMPKEPDIVELNQALPQFDSPGAMRNWLLANGLDADLLVSTYRNWLTERGFTNASPLLGHKGSLPRTDYSQEDDATLLMLAARNDVGALHELAERSLASDPLAALEWYDQAIVGGSVYAMQRVADLLTTLADPGLEEFASSEAWQGALATINADTEPPLVRALAWALAAVTVGGYATLDTAQAGRISNLELQLGSGAVQRSCELAQDYVLATVAARRERGGTLLSMEFPPLGLSVARPDQVSGCDVRIAPLVELSDCVQQDFYDPELNMQTLWLCPVTW